MKIHSTNYFDTFIEVAEDTNVTVGTIPPSKENKTVAEMQYEIISKNPYKYTSDDVLFQIFAERNDVPESAYIQEREKFFSKGQACFRASPLTKSYGFGIHCNTDGKIALFGLESKEYQTLLKDQKTCKVKAMKSVKNK